VSSIVDTPSCCNCLLPDSLVLCLRHTLVHPFSPPPCPCPAASQHLLQMPSAVSVHVAWPSICWSPS
jgi:hypothetical protein